jgi:hypothetical protein
MARASKKSTSFFGPIGRAASTFGDGGVAAGVMLPPRGPLDTSVLPNTPDGTSPNMAY